MSLSRLKKELEMLQTDPGPGISAWVVDDANILNLEAQIEGPEDSPFKEGTYRLSVHVPERYPMEPPRVRFMTPIYHPNIDSEGRICLDTLKMQPQGCWSPSININTVLLTIRVLMAQPNAEDGLVPDITEEYKRDVNMWKKKALLHSRANAIAKAPEPIETATNTTAAAEGKVAGAAGALPVDAKEDDDDDHDHDDDDKDDDDDDDEDEDEDEEVGVSMFADGAAPKRRRVV
jgi:ubiquitin-conjugating enzyme E2 T